MEVSWKSLVEDLQDFPGSALQLRSASQWDEEGSAYVVVSLELGEIFDSKRLKVMITSDSGRIRIELVEVEVEAQLGQPRGKQRRRGAKSRARERAVPEGAAEALATANAAVAGGRGPLSIRSALLRLCDELYVELNAEQSAALSALGKRASGEPKHQEEDDELPARPLPLFREASRATSGGVSALSFEDQDDCFMATDSEYEETGDNRPCATKPCAVPAWRCTEDLNRDGPPVEEVMAWTAAMDGLRKFPGAALRLKSAGGWDGREGLVELALQSPEVWSDWEWLDVMIVVGSRHPTTVELKGAQVVPPTVAAAVAEVNSHDGIGSGPQSLCTVIRVLCDTLGLDLDEKQKEIIKALGSREKSAGLRLQAGLRGGEGASELQRELLAVDALKVQSGFIEQQIQHLEHRQLCAPCIAPELQCEVERLKRSLAEVSAERTAAASSLQAVMLELTDTGGGARVSISVHLSDAPSQSLRGRSVEEATRLIKEGLASSGPWGHYAAHQFASMLAREQELHSEFVCFYHSYSYAALLYEVQAEVARRLLALPADSAPVPRLSAAAAGAGDLTALRKLGGRDHDPGFRALGLSCSCSIFAYGSEAPPMVCFQGGYSCTDVNLRQLLVDFLAKCCDDRNQGEQLADAVVKAGEKHALSVQMYSSGPGCPAAHGTLTGYMLQIFVRRSLVKSFAYPSEPMGKPIMVDIIPYLEGKDRADGQARILFQPKVFLDPSKVRLYHYCARPLQSCMDTDLAGSRGCLIEALKEALSPLFKQPLDNIKQRLKLK